MYCQSELPDRGSRACPSCRQKLSALQRERLQQFEEQQGSATDVRGDLFAFIHDHLNWIVGAVVIALLFYKFAHPSPYAAPQIVTASFSTPGDACFHKKRCLVIYSAPWCPACNGDVSFVNELSSYFNETRNVGLKVYIGNDSEEKMEAFAEKYRGMTSIDYDGSVRRSLSVHSYPSYYWITDEGNVTKSPRGSYIIQPGKSKVESYVDTFFGDEKGLF